MEKNKVGILNLVKNENNTPTFPKKNYPNIKTEFSTDISQYELISPIGGIDDISYLYLALYIPTNEYVALKYTDLTISIDYELINELNNTVINTHLLKHPNILSYYTDFIENDRLWTVTYPMKAGACSTILNDYFQDGFSEMMASIILKKVLKAVQYLHNNNLVHNDIRASNILLDFNGDVKLTGFHQLSSLVINGGLKKSIFTPIGDNHEWAAPEIIAQNTSHNQKSDIYSIGITALELVYNKTPFDEWPSAKILLSKILYPIPMIKSEKKLSDNFWSFVSACVKKDPKDRPTASELLETPFIKKAKNTRYIESILKKSGIINKHLAAIESVIQKLSEIREKSRQARSLENEKTREYNEELKMKQLQMIFSDDYSFNIDDLEILPEDQEQMNMEMENNRENNMENNKDEEEIQWREMKSQTLSSETIKIENNSTSMCNNNKNSTNKIHNSNSVNYEAPQSQMQLSIHSLQQQTSQSPLSSQILQNQHLVYTNPNSRSIPNSNSQISSLKYVSTHSFEKQVQLSRSASTQSNGNIINESHSNSKIDNESQSNGNIINASYSNSKIDNESQSKRINSNSNNINSSLKNENDSINKSIKLNFSNDYLTNKNNSEKMDGSELYENKKYKYSEDSNITMASTERSSSHLTKKISTKNLIKEYEEKIKALNKNNENHVNYQISQPNILGKKRKLFY